MDDSTSTSIHRAATIRQRVRLTAPALAAVEQAFTWLAEGRAVMPPVMHIDVPGERAGERGPGDVDIKSAVVAGVDRFAVKIASGFFGNIERGLPSGSGLMVVLSAETGFCDAVLLDQGYLTDVRTALGGAVAAKHLAPERVDTVGVVGSGVQARFQVEALTLVREVERVLVSARDAGRLAAYCHDMGALLGPEVEVAVAPSLEALVGESQVVVTATPSRAPLLRAAWLHPGLHITAMGADLPGKQELEADLLRRADLVVCDARSQATRLGELQHLEPAEADRAIELGEITSGARAGRPDDRAITICDLTGTGVQDTAIALFALEQLDAARTRRRGS